MAAVIKGMKDTLDEAARGFERPPLAHPVFLNCVPKSGTHLIRNVMRMFVPSEQHFHRDFIQLPNLRLHAPTAFSWTAPYLSWGHLLFCDDAAIALRGVRQVVLVRDPYDWVLARTRFYLSDQFQGNLNHVKGGAASVEEVMNMMILGVHQKVPSLLDIFTHNAAAWTGTSAEIVRYEDLARHAKAPDTAEAEVFFARLLDACGVARPDDWCERVRLGADRRQSTTARENLVVHGDVPDVLPAAQKRLVDFSAPGLRALFGYA